ncbi:hypothetical protein K469DRAFT_692145 [Zopfia rhizophila CBS 207.26]|uniref:Uncharacterized protein n=1 Tax=Zopfia rhizophila CBS 207.26 TaxID=1314779 RepID=A0A6A6DQJ7_9PEZI|nr:hypothetical protein K469DRAFT_692145 [Zopfia rhizophila CBS 207.26]
MALELYIHPCIHNRPHHLHPPPPDKPLRIQIQGPLESIQKLLPNVSWHPIGPFPQLGGLKLASLTHQKLYGQEGLEGADGALVVRDEYPGWVMEGGIPLDYIDYYGVTFDHLVPADDLNPEVLAISIIEVDNDGGAFANEVLSFPIDPTEYTGKKVLAVPRCCQVKKGTQDRGRVNGLVAERDREIQRCPQRDRPLHTKILRPLEREDHRPLGRNASI